jgi:hypothetical protein
MRTLRIEDIKENPWTVMVYPLPEHPARFFLILAQIAATCCRQFAEETIMELEPTEPNPECSSPKMRVALKDWHRAHQKIGEICYLLQDEYGVPSFDFCMSRNITWKRAKK